MKRRGLLAASYPALAALAAACQTPPYCAPLQKCGGDLLAGALDIWKTDGIPDSEWVVVADDSCMDQLNTPPIPVSLVRQPPHTSTDRPPEPTTADWCSNLVVNQDGTLQQLVGWYPPIPVRDGALTLSADGTYTMQLTFFARQRTEFSAACLTAQGVSLGCPAFGRMLKSFVAAEANIHNVICFPRDGGGGGCACEYDLSMIGGPNGPWVAQGGTLTFFDDLFGPPALADYCVDGDALDLTGQDGARLFNQPGLRTLRLRRPTCGDGVQSRALGEEGADCGGACGGVCPRCDDGQQNGKEEGVDCGGPCPVLCSCFDQVANPWEEGIDCGGPCPVACPP